MMISYRVLSGASAKDLEDQVADLCKEGYIPQGGVEITTYKDGSVSWSQAVARVGEA